MRERKYHSVFPSPLDSDCERPDEDPTHKQQAPNANGSRPKMPVSLVNDTLVYCYIYIHDNPNRLLSSRKYFQKIKPWVNMKATMKILPGKKQKRD